MLTALARELQKLVSTQAVIRVAIDCHWPAARSIRIIHIELLVRDPALGRVTRLTYRSPLVRTRFDRQTDLGQVQDDDFRDTNCDAWNHVVDDWERYSAGWGIPTAILAVDLTDDEKRSISPSHPRLLQEFARLQSLLEQRIRGRRGPQGDYVQAYRQLGHMIEVQNKAWSAVYPL